jgi:hypothetical protein
MIFAVIGVIFVAVLAFALKPRKSPHDAHANPSSLRNDSRSDSRRESTPRPAYMDAEAELKRSIRVFLHLYPEWEGKDFQNDPDSPWNNDPRFAAKLRNSRRAARSKAPAPTSKEFGPSEDPIFSKFDVWR